MCISEKYMGGFRGERGIKAQRWLNLCTKIFVSIPAMHAHITYHSMHHFHSLQPDLVDHLRYVDRVLFFYLLQNMVDGDEGASTTNSST